MFIDILIGLTVFIIIMLFIIWADRTNDGSYVILGGSRYTFDGEGSFRSDNAESDINGFEGFDGGDSGGGGASGNWES